jgi:transposase InsO family protein
MIRRMKEELIWLREWNGETELRKELDKWVQYYNRSYLHSSHRYRTPIQAEAEYYKKSNTHESAVDQS